MVILKSTVVVQLSVDDDYVEVTPAHWAQLCSFLGQKYVLIKNIV